MKKIYCCFFACATLCGCADPVKQATEKFEKDHNIYMADQLAYLNSTMRFLEYAVPSNYWSIDNHFSEELLSDICDKQHKLVRELNTFGYNDHVTAQAVSDLKQYAIRKHRDLKSSLDKMQGNSLLSLYAFGFGSALMMASGESTTVPEDMTDLFDELTDVIEEHYYEVVPGAIFLSEYNSIGSRSLTLEEFKEIRKHTIEYIAMQLQANIRGVGGEFKSSVIKDILSAFSNGYPVNGSYEFVKRNGKYTGILLELRSVGEGDYCKYHAPSETDLDDGVLFLSASGKSLFRYAVLEDDVFVHNLTGRYTESDSAIVCQFDTDYVLSESGSRQEATDYKIELQKSDCSLYPYFIRHEFEYENGNAGFRFEVAKVAEFDVFHDFIEILSDKEISAMLLK